LRLPLRPPPPPTCVHVATRLVTRAEPFTRHDSQLCPSLEVQAGAPRRRNISTQVARHRSRLSSRSGPPTPRPAPVCTSQPLRRHLSGENARGFWKRLVAGAGAGPAYIMHDARCRQARGVCECLSSGLKARLSLTSSSSSPAAASSALYRVGAVTLPGVASHAPCAMARTTASMAYSAASTLPGSNVRSACVLCFPRGLVASRLLGSLLWYRPGLFHCRFRIAAGQTSFTAVPGRQRNCFPSESARVLTRFSERL
jgi:hypothetical protein